MFYKETFKKEAVKNTLRFIVSPETLLIFIIPLLTFGFNIFENSPLYEKIIGTENVSVIVNQKLLGLDFKGNRNHWLYSSTTKTDFDYIWKIVKKNTSTKFPLQLTTQTPVFLGISATRDTPSVVLPKPNNSSETLFLVPDSVPVFVGFCSVYTNGPSDCVFEENMFIIGTVSDVKKWVQDTKDDYRRIIDSFFAITSAILGVIIILSKGKEEVDERLTVVISDE